MGHFAELTEQLQQEFDVSRILVENYYSARRKEISKFRALSSWSECFGGIYLICVAIYVNLLMISSAALHFQPEVKSVGTLVWAVLMLFSAVCAISSALATRAPPPDLNGFEASFIVLKRHLNYIQAIDVERVLLVKEDIDELNSYIALFNSLHLNNCDFLDEQSKKIDEFAKQPIQGLLDKKEKK